MSSVCRKKLSLVFFYQRLFGISFPRFKLNIEHERLVVLAVFTRHRQTASRGPSGFHVELTQEPVTDPGSESRSTHKAKQDSAVGSLTKVHLMLCSRGPFYSSRGSRLFYQRSPTLFSHRMLFLTVYSFPNEYTPTRRREDRELEVGVTVDNRAVDSLMVHYQRVHIRRQRPRVEDPADRACSCSACFSPSIG